jgi:hypothetical protein
VCQVSERFGLLLQEYLRCCGPHRAELMLQNSVEQILKDLGEFVKRVKKDKRKEKLREELRKVSFPDKFGLALDPRLECSGVRVDKCKTMDSKKVPQPAALQSHHPCALQSHHPWALRRMDDRPPSFTFSPIPPSFNPR